MSVQDIIVSRGMLLLLLLCLIILIITFSASPPLTIWKTLDIISNTKQDSECNCHVSQEQNICNTTYCNKIAKKLLESMDTSVNPCDNFYKYACGSWGKHNPIPPHATTWSEDHIVTLKTYGRIIGVLAKRGKPDDIPPVRKARQFYRSCMNTGTIENQGVKPIVKILNSTGGWPVMTPGNIWSTYKPSWQKIDKQYLPLIHSSAFYQVGFEVDPNNTNRYMLAINQYSDLLTKKKDFFDAYEEHFLRILHVIKAFAKQSKYGLNQRVLDNDISKIVHFTYKLMNITEDDKENHTSDDTYEIMTIEELQKWYDSSGITAPTAEINFLDIIQSIFKMANVSINASEPILVHNPKFFHKLARLLGHTSQRVLVNYVQWNLVKKFVIYTTKEMRDEEFRKLSSSYDVSSDVPRWVECLSDIKMGHAISYMFVKRFISDDVINKANGMVGNLKAALRQRITGAHWISEADKRSLMQKLDAIESQIGYPDWYKDDQALIKYYEELTIGSDYFQNVLNCEEYEFLRTLRKFREPVVRNEWSGYPVTVNAFNDQQKNVINVPAAELQDPYLTPRLPEAINYGNIGFVIGHELSHSFDNEGILLDANGYERAWVSQEMFEKYEERATCFVKQYSNYTLDVKDKRGRRIKLDGRLTECENVADSIGIQIAYSAYRKVAEEEPQLKLPGLENVSNEKLFFLIFANSWCSSVKRKYELIAASTDEHSPPMHRIIGSLSNMAEFSQIFRCPRNSPMNPQNKCNLWD